MTALPSDELPPLRPRLLVEAARAGMDAYSRRRLPRGLAAQHPEGGAGLVTSLWRLEAAQDARRRSGDAGYSPRAHVELLIACLAETRGIATQRAAPGRDGPIVSNVVTLT